MTCVVRCWRMQVLADEYVISVVLEGDANSLANATNQGAKAQQNLKKNTDSANIAFLAQVARYQAMTAALNQTIGGLNKMAGGLEAIGFERTAEATRKFTKYLELIAGPAEIYLAYLTLSIAMGMKDTKVKAGQTAATGVLATATGYLNTVMALNPFILIAMAVVVLVVALVALQKKFDILGGAINLINDGFQAMADFINMLYDAILGVTGPMQDFMDIITGGPLVRMITGEGG